MAHSETVNIDVRDLPLTSTAGAPVRLGEGRGVELVVLMRHRH